MNVLLSIKPKYVDEIINGNKKYEFRKSIFKNDVRCAYIYCSSPIKKIVGLFAIGEIINDAPEQLWEMFSDVAGIEKENFFHYFENKEEGFAIEIKKLHIFEEPKELNDLFPGFTPPQSFCYIGEL
jgi:predicted transcriptional regulator